MFQSPCGDLLGGKGVVTRSGLNSLISVSVPLRGFVRRKGDLFGGGDSENSVSVPLRGFVRRKGWERADILINPLVSVPLRGFVRRKDKRREMTTTARR